MSRNSNASKKVTDIARFFLICHSKYTKWMKTYIKIYR